MSAMILFANLSAVVFFRVAVVLLSFLLAVFVFNAKCLHFM